LKWLKRGRSFWLAFIDWVTWAVLLWLALLVWLPRHYYEQKLAAISQAEKTEDYTIQVFQMLDGSKHPISNARVSVQFDDVPPSTYERNTDDQGYMRFKWKAAGRLFVHVTVKVDGFAPFKNDSYLTPREQLEIQFLH
jgi:hypothetical protein